MKHRVIPGAIALLALAGSGGILQAQQIPLQQSPKPPQWFYGTGVATTGLLGPNGECQGLGILVNPQFMFTAEHPLGRSLALAFTARVHVAYDRANPICDVPRAGTYISLTDNPLGRTFAATDVRLEFAPRLAWISPMLGLGGGGLYSGGTPNPYGLVAGGFGFALGRSRVAILGEYQRLRLSGYVTQRTFAVDPTYTYPVLVSQKDVGPGAIWESAGLLAVRFDFKVRTPR